MRNKENVIFITLLCVLCAFVFIIFITAKKRGPSVFWAKNAKNTEGPTPCLQCKPLKTIPMT
jgi:hypothetical protein